MCALNHGPSPLIVVSHRPVIAYFIFSPLDDASLKARDFFPCSFVLRTVMPYQELDQYVTQINGNDYTAENKGPEESM